MYSTCLFCHASLGANDAVERFPVGRRLAFDPTRGRLWAVCGNCGQWNLAPLEERWEAVEECERRFRGTLLRYSTGNVGLAWLPEGAELVRVGKALRPEVAAWRFGRVLLRRRSIGARLGGRAASVALRAISALSPHPIGAPTDDRAALARLLARHRGSRVVDVVRTASGDAAASGASHTDVPIAVVRYRHLERVALVRPETGRSWALLVPHDRGTLRVEGDAAIRTAAKLLAAVNGTGTAGGVSREVLDAAARKVDESAQPDSYFNRVFALALRSSWGRDGAAADTPSPDDAPHPRLGVQRLEGARSDVERLALRLTGRTFWGHGGIGSEPRASLLDVPLVDRLALEMAAHEEAERRALEGELAELEEAWREAEEIAAIADAMFLPANVESGVAQLRSGA